MIFILKYTLINKLQIGIATTPATTVATATTITSAMTITESKKESEENHVDFNISDAF